MGKDIRWGRPLGERHKSLKIKGLPNQREPLSLRLRF
jgi:hypothetical protein